MSKINSSSFEISEKSYDLKDNYITLVEFYDSKYSKYQLVMNDFSKVFPIFKRKNCEKDLELNFLYKKSKIRDEKIINDLVKEIESAKSGGRRKVTKSRTKKLLLEKSEEELYIDINDNIPKLDLDYYEEDDDEI